MSPSPGSVVTGLAVTELSPPHRPDGAGEDKENYRNPEEKSQVEAPRETTALAHGQGAARRCILTPLYCCPPLSHCLPAAIPARARGPAGLPGRSVGQTRGTPWADEAVQPSQPCIAGSSTCGLAAAPQAHPWPSHLCAFAHSIPSARNSLAQFLSPSKSYASFKPHSEMASLFLNCSESTHLSSLASFPHVFFPLPSLGAGAMPHSSLQP